MLQVLREDLCEIAGTTGYKWNDKFCDFRLLRLFIFGFGLRFFFPTRMNEVPLSYLRTEEGV